tara:strand:+ start:512 stop:1228 length:717 start_codon:yes stop_codon:yes gene_type:complete
MKTLIIIPTYNESKTIKNIIEIIFNIDSNYQILVIDDNSPDRTDLIIEDLKSKYENLYLIKRLGKLGLGTAYCEGFKWAIKHEYDKVVQIDADMSHDPFDIPRLIKNSNEYDLVIGSRYKTGINVVNWPLRRLLLSYFANIYSKILTGMPIKDSTAGFKCFNIDVLKSIDLNSINSSGYSFQIEMNFITWLKSWKIIEIPVIFHDRSIGESKMSKKIILEAIVMVPFLRIKKILRLYK